MSTLQTALITAGLVARRAATKAAKFQFPTLDPHHTRIVGDIEASRKPLVFSNGQFTTTTTTSDGGDIHYHASSVVEEMIQSGHLVTENQTEFFASKNAKKMYYHEWASAILRDRRAIMSWPKSLMLRIIDFAGYKFEDREGFYKYGYCICTGSLKDHHESHTVPAISFAHKEDDRIASVAFEIISRMVNGQVAYILSRMYALHNETAANDSGEDEEKKVA